ncbi:MAG: membrane protein insertion efficiency factor YidD [Clostridia bacterium]|nr:membrane protein insertion efficiency factor YidD [Clostridia bacterium]MDD4685840.1 membrane protein insertion efficiency factor YidD [Clostridia bacterium]
MIKIITLPLNYVCIGLVWLYKILISPLLPRVCPYTPTCSKYMINAIKEFGFAKGIVLGSGRLLRCSPKHKGCYDPIPLNLKGDLKWIL